MSQSSCSLHVPEAAEGKRSEHLPGPQKYVEYGLWGSGFMVLGQYLASFSPTPTPCLVGKSIPRESKRKNYLYL